MVGSNTAARRFPAALAVYIATSALRSSTSAVSSARLVAAIPMLAPTAISWPPIWNGTCRASMIRWATASERSRFGRIEEQHRELVATEPRSQVVGADAAVDALGDDPQEAVAGPVAQRVVDDLEVVEVEEQDDGIEPGLAGAQLRIDLLGEHRPVRQPGQRVVVGLVAELLLEAGQLGE